jgi:outer membrane protein OmpA-like peptidoglycan-associated protein
LSDSRNNPPPDDWAKTRPNINLPDSDDGPAADWDKTNYNYPKQPAADEWGKTVMNIKPINTSGQDYGKTIFPNATPKQPDNDWAATRANVNIADADFGETPADAGGGYGKTTPYFQLPEAEKAKYQQLPPTPTEQAAKEAQEKKEKGGIPGWVWILGGGLLIFFFFVIVLAVVGFFFLWGGSTFEATVKSAPPGSVVFVDDVQWGVTNEDGSIRLLNLRGGRRTVKITHPNFTCEPREVTGGNGVTPEPIIARCQAVALKEGETCESFQPGEFDKAERCYNKALDDLPDPFTDEQLVKALNILIINFDVNKYDVPPERLAALQKGSTFIKKLQAREPTTVLEVGGHTDSDGSDSDNQTLSNNRANAVKAILVRFGVNAAGLQTRGYGETQPKFDNNTPQGKFLNRRIQYSIVKR